MSDSHAVDTEVRWNWGQGEGCGEVGEVFKERVARTLKRIEVTHDTDEGNATYLIEQQSVDDLLNEIERIDGQTTG